MKGSQPHPTIAHKGDNGEVILTKENFLNTENDNNHREELTQ